MLPAKETFERLTAIRTVSSGEAVDARSRVLAHDAAWMPDGIQYSLRHRQRLGRDRSERRFCYAICQLPGRAFWLRWSPDGNLLRFTLFDPVTHGAALCEMESGSRTPRPVRLPGLEYFSACCGVWLPDGQSYVFQANENLWQLKGSGRRARLIQLTNREKIAHFADLFSPRWSPDGRWIVELTLDQKVILLYDVARRHWQRLASTSAADPVWSSNSKAIYVHAFRADREPILRVDVPSGAMRTVADLANFHSGEVANYFFGGTTLRGEPLVQPRVGTGNLYTLDLASP